MALSITEAEFTKNPPEGIVAGPIDENNFFTWNAVIEYALDRGDDDDDVLEDL